MWRGRENFSVAEAALFRLSGSKRKKNRGVGKYEFCSRSTHFERSGGGRKFVPERAFRERASAIFVEYLKTAEVGSQRECEERKGISE